MKTIDRFFGGIKLTWIKLIILAVVIAALVAGFNLIPAFEDTSLTDPAVSFEFWILCGIFIIMNSKSNLDSALKCFIFFLVSQPLIYLFEVPWLGWSVFGYYRYWFYWTLLCFPMGFIGYYLKKNKTWCVIILAPMLLLDLVEGFGYLKTCIYEFPRHFITVIFDLTTAFIYVFAVLKDKKAKIIGLILNVTMILVFGFMIIRNPKVYNVQPILSEETKDASEWSLEYDNHSLGDITLIDNEYGVFVSGNFYHAGTVNMTITDHKNVVHKYILVVKNNTYTFDEME